mmetsp:Transcript_31490/g.86114  ORF Transcript_31490/g.86114 Transcript_31490/m.86114 type:complete len:251 (-) Transcript_31490:249-1001(-)
MGIRSGRVQRRSSPERHLRVGERAKGRLVRRGGGRRAGGERSGCRRAVVQSPALRCVRLCPRRVDRLHAVVLFGVRRRSQPRTRERRAVQLHAGHRGRRHARSDAHVRDAERGGRQARPENRRRAVADRVAVERELQHRGLCDGERRSPASNAGVRVDAQITEQGPRTRNRRGGRQCRVADANRARRRGRSCDRGRQGVRRAAGLRERPVHAGPRGHDDGPRRQHGGDAVADADAPKPEGYRCHLHSGHV